MNTIGASSRHPAGMAHNLRSSRARLAGATLLAAVLACASTAAQAGSCIVSASAINFGAYDPITTTSPVDSAGNVQVDCDPTTFGELLFGVQVSISLSRGSSGSYAARTLRQPPASILQYNLYTTAARTTVWGDGNGGTQTVDGAVGGYLSGQPTPRSFPVFGRIPTGQDPNLGLHSDTITVTITF
ncbi:MAG TPA: spore coat U domain-containing protein [Luteimonas sp.]|nr:spore coat U domain-containing protein [Luteimonas sp.]